MLKVVDALPESQRATAFDATESGLIKRIAKPHQYFAVTKAVASTINAVDSDGRAGVVWHTQGSGKSMEMELYTAKVMRHERLANPTVVVITDRTELDTQLFDGFRASTLLPEDPAARRRRVQAEHGWSDLELRDVMNAGALDLIEATIAAGGTAAGAKKWWLGEVARRANEANQPLTEYATQVGVTPGAIAELEGLVSSGRLNDKMAREVMGGVLDGEGTPTQVADARGLELVEDDDALQAAVTTVIERNPDIAEKIRGGKVQAAGALIGQVMKEMKGQADAGKARSLILAALGVEG